MAKVKFYRGTQAPTKDNLPDGGVYFSVSAPIIYMNNDGIIYSYYGNAPQYHTSGTWSGLTYKATAKNGADELKFTIPTGTTSTTVAAGNHTHSITSDNSSSSTQYLAIISSGANNTNGLKYSTKLPYIPSFNVLGDTQLKLNCNTISVYQYGGGVVIGNKTIQYNSVLSEGFSFDVNSEDSGGTTFFALDKNRFIKYDICICTNMDTMDVSTWTTTTLITPPYMSMYQTGDLIYSAPFKVGTKHVCLVFEYNGTDNICTLRGFDVVAASLVTNNSTDEATNLATVKYF